MNKTPINKTDLKKIIQTSQAIEGYKPATEEIIQKIKQLRKQHGIQVSPQK